MRRPHLLLWLLVWAAGAAPGRSAPDRSAPTPEIVTFESDGLKLKGVLFRPPGKGPFPLIVYAHGNEPDPSHVFPAVSPALVARGYAVLGPHRRGSGLSADQAPNLLAALTAIEQREGGEARARASIAALEGPHLRDMAASICFAKGLAFVDPHRVYMIGGSFGGVLTMLAAERGLGLRAGADFAGAAINWDRSPLFKARLSRAAARARIPLFVAQAENDFNLAPTREIGRILAAGRKPHRARIYPPFGTSREEGHSFDIYGAEIWAPEVLAFFEAAPPSKSLGPCRRRR